MKVLKNIVAIALIFISLSGFSQAEKNVKRRKKMLEKQKIEKEKAQDKALEEGKKKHMEIQTKETRKRMKKHAKQTKRYKNGKPPEKKKFFLFRIFG